MGCDIHATIEYEKYRKERPDVNIWWRGLAKDFAIDRWYDLFGHLAGVRREGEIEPIVPPRGVPTDASFEFKEEYEKWDSDAHTPSWLTFAELKKLPDEFKDEMFYKVMELAAERYGDDNVRLVFFFDN